MARGNVSRAVHLPRPSIVDVAIHDVPDLIRDERSGVIVSAGNRDRGPEVRRGPKGGKRPVHAHVERVEVSYEEDKTPHTVTRVVDTLAMMRNKGTLTKDQYGAGVRFQDAFDLANLVRSSGMRFDGMPPGCGGAGDLPAAVMDARNEVFAAMKSLGGQKTACGIAAWWILGMRWSLRSVAEREVVKNYQVWTGILVSTLDILDMHYDGST